MQVMSVRPASHAYNNNLFTQPPCLPTPQRAPAASIFGAPLPGWTRDGKKDAVAWTSDGAVMLQPTREALAKYLKDYVVPAHRYWPVSTTEIAAQQPPEQRMSGPGRAAVAEGSQGDGGRSRLIG